MAVCLITGASGFLGRHLGNLLRVEPPAYETLIAVGRKRPESWPVESFRPINLNDHTGIAGLIAELAPFTVFHVAGKTPPGVADDYYRHNTLATVSLLDALRAVGRPCRVVLVGSAAELGPVPVESLPVREDHPCRPADPYGLSKWLATCAGLAAGGFLEVVVARVFNPIGPGMPASQALGSFADVLAQGIGPTSITVGDLEVARDFVDVRDVARALVALAANGQPGQIYHVGTGRSHRVGEGLDRLIALSEREVRVDVDPARSRNRGPADSRADIGRIATDTGWVAEVTWEQSLRDLWDDALARAGTGLTEPPTFV